jgi:hypothetical protein
MKVLFIGNSQMRKHNVPELVQALSHSAPSDAHRIESSPVTGGGKTLQLHWDAGEAEGKPRSVIAQGGWDRVVVQEIYSASEEDFRAYAALFDAAIRQAGSETVLFATANVTRYYREEFVFPESFKQLNDMQIAFGHERGIPVAAAGYAWLRYLGENPSEEALLDLYDEDRGHPGFKGSYIYACLLYAVLTERSPIGLTTDLRGRNGETITESEGHKMQEVAWQEYLDSA